MENLTQLIAESYTKRLMLEQHGLSNAMHIAEAIAEYEESNNLELNEEQIKLVVEKFLYTIYK